MPGVGYVLNVGQLGQQILAGTGAGGLFGKDNNAFVPGQFGLPFTCGLLGQAKKLLEMAECPTPTSHPVVFKAFRFREQ
jgi:hypothetical protein